MEVTAAPVVVEGHESAEWLSYIIQEMWPYSAPIVQSVLVEYVQPALAAAMPATFPSLRFTRIDIGSNAVVVDAVRVLPGKHDDELFIEADVVFQGSPNIELSFGDNTSLNTFGINSVTCRGRLECLVRPLIPRPPLFGAVSCSFIDPPELDFSLSGLAAVGDAGLFKKIIQGAVTSTFSSMLVMPNRLVFKLDPRLDFLSFAAHPVGVLRVAALSGTGFPLTDESRLKQALGALPDPDVYLTLQVGSICKSTDRVDDQTDPVWTGAVHDFVLSSSSDAQQLIIKAYDYDVGFDDFLGYAKVRISDLIKTRICRIPLIDSPMGATPAVSLSARWLPLSGELRPIQSAVVAQRTDKKMPPGCSRLLLTVNVDEGRNLPAVGKRPFVRCQVGPHRFETWAAYELSGVISVCNPDYESSFHALLQSDVDTETRIEFSVIDQKSGQTIGTAYCLFSEVLQAGPNGKVFKFALMQCKVGASLRVRVKLEAIIDSPPLWEEILTTTTSAEQAATLTRAHDA